MNNQNDLRILSIERLAALCAEHTQLFKAGKTSDARYCYELIHRAVLDIPGGWDAVDRQYRPWIRRVVSRYCQDNPAEIERSGSGNFHQVFAVYYPSDMDALS